MKSSARHFPATRFLLAVTLTLSTVCHADDQSPPSAFLAMRAAINALPPDNAARIIEVTGQLGEPDPTTWEITFFDPDARADLRIVTVRNGIVTSQKQPSRGFTGSGAPTAIDPAKLNVDSTAAFTVAERRAGTPFSYLNYRLHPGGESQPPRWSVELFNRQKDLVATLTIAADDGSLLHASHPVTDSTTAATTTTADSDSDSDSFFTRAGRTLNRTGHDIQRGFLHVGGELQEFFTGNRTIDRQE